MPRRNLFLHITPYTKAKELGFKNYFTGRPCIHGHISTRNIHGGGCNECSRIKAEKLRKDNPDYQKKIDARHYKKHSEKLKQKSRDWRAENKEKVSESNKNRYYSDIESSRKRCRDLARKNSELRKEKSKEWRRKNKSKKREYDRRRIANKLMATPAWFEREMVKNVYEKAAIMGFEVDHVVPLKSKLVCGLHCWSNLQLLEREINMKKNNRHWPDMPNCNDKELTRIVREFYV